MHTRLTGILAFVAAFALCTAGASAITVNSPFNSNNENWRTVGESDCNAPAGAAFWTTSGNPGGTIRGTDADSADGCAWFFLSPVPLSGNRVANYGGTITFDLFANGAPSRNTQIVLADAQGKLIGAAKSAPPPASTWTTV